jgi:hypothetical protein
MFKIPLSTIFVDQEYRGQYELFFGRINLHKTKTFRYAHLGWPFY